MQRPQMLLQLRRRRQRQEGQGPSSPHHWQVGRVGRQRLCYLFGGGLLPRGDDGAAGVQEPAVKQVHLACMAVQCKVAVRSSTLQ
jgi:hypothetical protein